MWRPNELVRGGDRLDELIAAVMQTFQLTVETPLEVQKNPDAFHIRYAAEPMKLVRITGHAAGVYSGTTFPSNHYTGQEQLYFLGDDVSTDLYSGTEFTDDYPLIEINGATNVPVDTIVIAVPALSGDHYEFVVGGGSGSLNPCPQSGSGGCCNLRLSDLFVRDDSCSILDGCFQIVDGNGDPVDLYLRFIQDGQ